MRRVPAPLLATILLGVGLTGCLSTPASDGSDLNEGVVDPLALLSPIRYDAILRQPLMVPSSIDGVALRVDVYKPEGDGPFPTILVQSPYWSFGGDAKDGDPAPGWYPEYFVPRGYAVSLGEMRGTRDSGGCWDFGGPRDQQDGHDIVEALAAQGWSNGKVGMLGQSHVGMSQIAAAITAPPHLTTIVPIAAVSDWYRYLHKDGAPYVTNRGTPPAYFAVHASPSTESVGPDWVLTQAQTACVDNVVHVSKSAELHGDKDRYWQERDLIAGAGDVKASVFLVHGFLDENVKTDHFLDFWRGLPADLPKKAWYGQWAHAHPSYYEWRHDLHRWYDYWLMGIENGIMDEPAVTVQDNLRAARSETDWPSSKTAWQAWAPHEGSLSPDVGRELDRRTATYTALPGQDRGSSSVALLQPSVGFISEPLERDLHIGGEPILNLTGILDQPTGRWIAVLFDVDPSGERDEITRAYRDARHRESLESGKDVPVGQQVQYTLNFYPRDHVVEAGHRLELVLYGGDMGCTVAGDTCEGTGIIGVERPVAHTVVTGPEPTTRLLLPIVDVPGPARTLTELDGWLQDLPP